FAFGWDTREPHAVCSGPQSQLARVCFPDLSSPRLNLIAVFKLCAKERRQQVRRQIARPDVYPRILVHLTSEKSAAIRSLFPKNFGALVKPLIIDQQCATFSARKIFRLVEA